MFGTMQKVQSLKNPISVSIAGIPIALANYVESLRLLSILVSFSTTMSEKFANDATTTSRVSVMCKQISRLTRRTWLVAISSPHD